MMELVRTMNWLRFCPQAFRSRASIYRDAIDKETRVSTGSVITGYYVLSAGSDNRGTV